MPYKDPLRKKENARVYAAKNREKIRDRLAAWRARNPDLDRAARNREREALWSNPQRLERKRVRGRDYHRDIRRLLVAIYGEECCCCGEKRFEFLSLDHVNGGGRQERGQGTARFYKSLLENRRSDIRILCHNCNLALGFYGYCPHGGLD